jgi:hypothetical protein
MRTYLFVVEKETGADSNDVEEEVYDVEDLQDHTNFDDFQIP